MRSSNFSTVREVADALAGKLKAADCLAVDKVVVFMGVNL